MRKSLDSLDVKVLAIVGVLLAAYWTAHVDRSTVLGEDAAILMRYSKHLAEGHGIVWNVGEKPVDGATDFLFMVSVAGLMKCGLALESATRYLGLVSHFLTVFLVYFGIRGTHAANRWFAGISASYLALGPAFEYIEAGFGTPFFAFFVCMAWYFGYRCLKEPQSRRAAQAFAVTCLAMGMARPEGVILAALMLASIVWFLGLRPARTVLTHFMACFVLPGAIYFLWRWHYFGYALPNPYYRKGGGLLYFDSLYSSLRGFAKMCFPFLPPFLLGLASSKNIRRETLFSLIPILGFAVAWVLISDEMNYFMRFQYGLLPMVLLSWVPLAQQGWKHWGLPKLEDFDPERRRRAFALLGVATVALLIFQYSFYKFVFPHRTGPYEVALLLRDYRTSGYTLATSEAGVLPLYSEWRTVDTWGLNDQWIAHHGVIDGAYLDRYKPELIVFHENSAAPRTPYYLQWSSMVAALKAYVAHRGYKLAAAFGVSPYNLHYYYVRADFAHSAEIIRRIQNTEYVWPDWPIGGLKCVNFAAFKVGELSPGTNQRRIADQGGAM